MVSFALDRRTTPPAPKPYAVLCGVCYRAAAYIRDPESHRLVLQLGLTHADADHVRGADLDLVGIR